MYSLETLLLNESFVDYCLNENSVYRDYWEQVMAAHPHMHETFAEAKKLAVMLSGGLQKNEIDAEIEKVKQQLQYKEPALPQEKEAGVMYVNSEGRLHKKIMKRVLIYSAAACVVLLCGIFFFQHNTQTAANAVIVPTTAQQFSSAFGTRHTVQLPDGTQVILNSGSSISIDGDYNATKRLVQLSGEAFFKVAKNAAKPFIVQSSTCTTTAIGTSFYVHAANAEKNYRVDLLEGKVKFSAKDSNIILSPGEEGRWLAGNMQLQKSNFDTLQLQQWIQGKLSFKNTPAQDVFNELEKWYGVTVTSNNHKISRRLISGEYNNIPLDDVLKVLCFTLSCKYSYKDNTVVIE